MAAIEHCVKQDEKIMVVDAMSAPAHQLDLPYLARTWRTGDHLKEHNLGSGTKTAPHIAEVVPGMPESKVLCSIF